MELITTVRDGVRSNSLSVVTSVDGVAIRVLPVGTCTDGAG